MHKTRLLIRPKLDSELENFAYSRHKQRQRQPQPDQISLSSLGPNATTIKVPYKRMVEQAQQATVKEPKVDELDNGSQLQSDIESLKQRLDNMKGRSSHIQTDQEPNHFDYKTVVANLRPISVAPKHQTVDTYNVRVIEHNSPFKADTIKSMSQVSDGVAKLELASSGIGSSRHSTTNDDILDNNNEANFNIIDFMKLKSSAASCMQLNSLQGDDDDDRCSVVSSNSLKSSRTYDIKTPLSRMDDDYSEKDREAPDEIELSSRKASDLDGYDEKRPTAWIFHPDDGSTTAIKTPPKPPKPEPPLAVTEDLSESRGGRSYYLELVEPTKRQPAQENSMQSLRSRWNSVNALLSSDRGIKQPSVLDRPVVKSTTSNSRLNTSGLPTRKNSNVKAPSRADTLTTRRPSEPQYQSTPKMTAMNRSKSIACLVPSIKPTRYSIYGGLRDKNGETKPVPRLSYSRAIGPKSQRPSGAQVKAAPSRYLKMK